MNKEEYLKSVRRALWKINKKKREEILLELRGEIEDRLENGEKIEYILRDMPDPKKLGREYLNIYGASIKLKMTLVLISAIISVFTLSVIPLTQILFYEAPGILMILALLLFYISQNFGWRTGLIAGIVAAILRFTLIYITSLQVALQSGTLLSEGVNSLILLIIPLLVKRKK